MRDLVGFDGQQMVTAETTTEPTVHDNHPLLDPQHREAVTPRLEKVDHRTRIPRLHLEHRHSRVELTLSNLHLRLLETV
jgi:hypothetical protein